MPKLRTVLWGWRGEPFDDDELAGLERVCDGARRRPALGAELRALLSRAEVRATTRRVDALLADGRFPLPLADLAGHPLAAVLS